MKRLCAFLVLLPMTSFAEVTAFTVDSKGRPPSGSMVKVKSSKVPSYDWSKKSTKLVPRIDIGEEAKFHFVDSYTALTASPAAKFNLEKKPKALELIKFDQSMTKVESANLKSIKKLEFEKLDPVNELKETYQATTKDPILKTIDVKDFNEDQKKLLQARILSEINGQQELAFGILSEILESKTNKFEIWLAYAQVARQLGLNSEFKNYVLKLNSESKNETLIKVALNEVVSHPESLEVLDIPVFDSIFQKREFATEGKSGWHLLRAKYYLEQAQLTQVEESLAQISEKDPEYLESLIVSGISKYRQGKIDDSQGLLSISLDKSEGQKTLNLRNLAALTLGRIYFQKSQYKEAFNAYLKVDKSSSFWLPAMQEQAWTQILSEDFEGAAGNMFSLHTEYFKHAYAPDSYVIRTVGYLNLCQFGDSAKVMEDFQKRYGNFKNKIDAYIEKKPKTDDFYELVRNWLKNPDQKEVNGVPRAFIVELARHPMFMNIQESINNREDEMTKFNKVALSIVQIERDQLTSKQTMTAELNKLKEKLAAKSTDTNLLQQEITAIESRIAKAEIYYQTAKKARNQLKAPRELAAIRTEKERTQLKSLAAKNLQTRFITVSDELTKALDQSEVLKYEIYSAAGEHLRYQMAGGDVNNKEREQLKVTNDKAIKWKFKGEIWEDEVGHFRSSLKNVCPTTDKVSKN